MACPEVVFAPLDAFPIGSTPVSVTVGDVDGDGVLDVATADVAGSVAVGFLTPEGMVDATSTVTLSGPEWPCLGAVAVADLTADGLSEVVVLDSCNAAVTLVGGGSRALTAGSVIDVGDAAAGMVVGLLDWDPRADLAIVSAEGQLVQWMGDETGTLRGPSTLALGGVPIGLFGVDADGEPPLDLAVPHPSTVQVWLVANGAYVLDAEVPSDDEPVSVATGDLDVDGAPDLVVVDKIGRIDTWIRVPNGDPLGPVPSPAGPPGKLVLADFTGDGCVSAAVTHPYDGAHFLRGLGDGTFAPGVPVSSGPPDGIVLVAAELDGAPPLDLALAAGGQVVLFRGAMP